MSDESPLWQYLPQLPGGYLHEFEQAYEAHKAAGEILRLANKHLPNMAPQILEKRKMLLLVPFQIIVQERNLALDSFCVAWIKYRGGKVESPRGASPVGGGDSQDAEGQVQEAVSRPLGDASSDGRSDQAGTPTTSAQ